MKKVLWVLLCLMFTLGSAFASWDKLDEGIYMDNESIKVKGNYLYLKLRYDKVGELINMLKKEYPGVLLDSNIVKYMAIDLIVDCKHPRYKTPLVMLYGNNGKMINKVRDNTWENNLTRAEWGAYCDMYDELSGSMDANKKD